LGSNAANIKSVDNLNQSMEDLVFSHQKDILKRD
jgi:hypothetical protein